MLLSKYMFRITRTLKFQTAFTTLLLSAHNMTMTPLINLWIAAPRKKPLVLKPLWGWLSKICNYGELESFRTVVCGVPLSLISITCLPFSALASWWLSDKACWPVVTDDQLPAAGNPRVSLAGIWNFQQISSLPCNLSIWYFYQYIWKIPWFFFWSVTVKGSWNCLHSRTCYWSHINLLTLGANHTRSLILSSRIN